MINNLTEREIDVLHYLCRGYSNIEIAKVLFISMHTVKAHIAVIQRKFGARNRTEIAYYTGKKNLI